MRITVIGDLLYDCFIWADRLPREGETVTGYKSGFFASGKGGNQAVQAARLGAEVFMIGKVGRDERGRLLKDTLRSNGVRTDFVFEDPMESTGTDCVMVDRTGRNAIVVAPNANARITPEEVRSARELIESSDVLLCQLQINEEAITEALTVARAAGVITVLNPAPARAIPDAYYDLVDYFTPNETEAEFFTGRYQNAFSPEEWRAETVRAFREKGIRNLVVTLGAEGALFADRERIFHVPAFRVRAVDSTAAGDSFNAAFSLGLAEGKPVSEAVRLGCAAGALTASGEGSVPSLPDRKELEEFLRNTENQEKEI